LNGVIAAYEAKIAAGELKPDPAQAAVVERLDRLAQTITGQKPVNGGLLGRFFAAKPEAAAKGLYIEGPVGRGKTMLMDLFHGELEGPPKRRVHFHAFMQDVHTRVHAARKSFASVDALKRVGEDLAAQARVLCLDEMQIADIADAMIVGRLFALLFEADVVVVTTSNTRPRDLYKDGLNRALFLPFLKLIEERMEVVSLANPTDYRLGRVKGYETYVTPLGPEANARIAELWARLTDSAPGGMEEIPVLGRRFLVPRAARGVARFGFEALCDAPVGAADYLALARAYSTLVLEHIPVLTPERRNAAKRFILLIDTLYDAGTRLVASAAAPPQLLYTTGDHATEFARTVSRLEEMQSASWWGRRIVET
jgi:cell division protein ZapE